MTYTLLLTLSALLAPTAVVDASHVQASLIADRAVVAPGEAAHVGVRFALEPEWHVYWRNPGESGEPPSFEWRLPEGVEITGPTWPTPRRIKVGPVHSFGYEGEVLLPFELQAPKEEGPFEVQVEASWLVCKEDCIPGQATLTRTLQVQRGSTTLDPLQAPRFEASAARTPLEAAAALGDEGDVLTIRLDEAALAPLEPLDLDALDFFPEIEGLVQLDAPVEARREGDDLVLRLAKRASAPAQLSALRGLVTIGDPPRAALAVEARPSATEEEDADVGVWWAIGLALLGGLLLNLMPCVFPVVSLKIVGFVEHAHGDAARVRAQGWAFGAGVLASFWALAGALIALRAIGEPLGWGFQLQSPAFLTALIALMLAMALSLSGVFEVGLSLTALGQHGQGNAFGTGALATLVATPCTAPFMGPAIGYALGQPAATSLAVFTALGAGMALPYVALAHAPGLLQRLPRPGAWMEGFRQLMAFPLYATVLWLLWVYAQQTEPQAVFELMAGLLTLALAAWIWGRAQRVGRAGPLRGALAMIAAAVGLWVSFASAGAPDPDPWAPWSEAEVEALRAEGRPVFVNFTAAWCVSCKVNERVVFEDADVQAAFEGHDVARVKADWTRKDAVIAAALRRHGREGVPLYLLYRPGQATPEVLPQILTPDGFIDTLAGR